MPASGIRRLQRPLRNPELHGYVAEGEMDCEEMLALTADELKSGLRLTCVGKPLGDCKIFA